MTLTRESAYALQALAELARRPAGASLSCAEMARAAGVPPTYLTKTLRKLTGRGVVWWPHGRRRGVALARPPGEVSVRSVLEAVEGPARFGRCVLWDVACSDDRPCPLHHEVRSVGDALATLLDGLTLADVARAPQPRGAAR
jgi:Rrf2 family protein